MEDVIKNGANILQYIDAVVVAIGLGAYFKLTIKDILDTIHKNEKENSKIKSKLYDLETKIERAHFKLKDSILTPNFMILKNDIKEIKEDLDKLKSFNGIKK